MIFGSLFRGEKKSYRKSKVNWCTVEIEDYDVYETMALKIHYQMIYNS